MKTLLACDGTPSADRALELVASTAWPADTTIRVVVAAHATHGWIGLDAQGGPIELLIELEEQFERDLRAVVERARERLAALPVVVETSLVRGRPSTVILDEALSSGVDLIVLGSRGHGAWETMLLGSVSAEVVSHAPCPVLVARTSRVARVILATDGSGPARRAEEFLLEHRLFIDAPMSVISVADVEPPWTALGPEPTVPDRWLEAQDTLIEEARRQHGALADEAAGRLRTTGYAATAELVEGPAAASIVATARDRQADLVVVGSRGHTGLTRLLIGSVARNVLLHAPCSVLVVRHTD